MTTTCTYTPEPSTISMTTVLYQSHQPSLLTTVLYLLSVELPTISMTTVLKPAVLSSHEDVIITRQTLRSPQANFLEAPTLVAHQLPFNRFDVIPRTLSRSA